MYVNLYSVQKKKKKKSAFLEHADTAWKGEEEQNLGNKERECTLNKICTHISRTRKGQSLVV